MSSANLKLFSHSPLMLIPTSLKSTLLNISYTAAVNKMGDSVSPWRTPLSIQILSLNLSVRICAVSPL